MMRFYPVAFVAFVLALFGLTGVAGAAGAAPGFSIDSFASPTHFATPSELADCTGGSECRNSYEVTVTNVGSEPTDGTPVTILDTLPHGLSVASIELLHWVRVTRADETGIPASDCGTVTSGEVVEAKCTFPGVVDPDDRLRMIVNVNVGAEAGPKLENLVNVSGGGAASVSSAEPGQMQQVNEVNPLAPPFGPSNFKFYKAGPNGAPETQAGGHPYELVTTIDSNNAFEGRTVRRGSHEHRTRQGHRRQSAPRLRGLDARGAGVHARAALRRSGRAPSLHRRLPAGHDRRVFEHRIGNGRLATSTRRSTTSSPSTASRPSLATSTSSRARTRSTRSVVPTPQGYALQTSSLEIPESQPPQDHRHVLRRSRREARRNRPARTGTRTAGESGSAQTGNRSRTHPAQRGTQRTGPTGNRVPAGPAGKHDRRTRTSCHAGPVLHEPDGCARAGNRSRRCGWTRGATRRRSTGRVSRSTSANRSGRN